MDINDFRSAFTVLSLIAFIGIVVWAYGSGRKREFEEAAMLPFTEDDRGGRA